MGVETISDGINPDYQIWTCDACGWSTCIPVGADVAECPGCIKNEYKDQQI